MHPIETRSYEILRTRVDLSMWSDGPRAVVARVIHATADLDYASSMVVDDEAVEAGVAALCAGAPVVADVQMTAAGVTVAPATTFVGSATADEGVTRSAAAMRLAASAFPRGAVWVVGCAPTALAELVRLAGAGLVEPALVVGLPVGFVGATEAKEALRASGLVAISNRGDKGGSAAAAAACNAIGRLALGRLAHVQR